jgi:hypothetical protein
MPGAELAALALAAALAAQPAAPAPAAPALRPCTLEVSADRIRLEANDPRAVQLTVTSPAAPRLQSSAGAVSEPEPAGPGRWTATWTAPPAGIPQIALLTALAGDDCGLLAVPLFGSGDAVVRTRPRAEVEVRIGERVFGPATAGADGVALIPVEVPPGVDSVFHGARRIPLDIPPLPHAYLVAWAAEAPADRERVVALLLAAVEPDGRPRAGAAPAVVVSAGVLGLGEPAGPGAWRLGWRLPVGPVGQVTATVRLPGEPAAELLLPRPAGAPASAALAAERAAATTDDGPIDLTLSLRDAAGHPADGPVEISADAGQTSSPRRVEAGRYAATWTPPARLDGRSEAQLTARVGAVEARSRVALQPGAPARLTLAAPAAELTADGLTTLPVVVELTDAHGNPVGRPPSAVRAAAGAVGAARPAGPGRYQLDYRPGPVTAWTSEEIVAELPPLTARLPLRLRPPTPRFTVGAWAGGALQPGGWLGLQAGGEATAWRWLAGQELGAGLSAAFSRFRDQRTTDAGGTPVAFTGELRTLTVLAVASWRRAAGRALAVGAEVGAGAGRVESLIGTGGPLLPESRWVLALGAGAWLGLPAWRGRAVVALRGAWLASPHFGSLQGTVAPLSLSLGYELDVP